MISLHSTTLTSLALNSRSRGNNQAAARLHPTRRPRPLPLRAASHEQRQDGIRMQRQQQLAATELLAKILQSGDPTAVAEEHLESLDEAFFQTASVYMQMAHKEGNTQVYETLKAAMQAAFEVKQRTLRPEIRLLNRLLAEEDSAARRRILNRQEAGDTIIMNDRYFFTLVDRMSADVERQPAHLPQRAGLLAKLAAIKQEATDRLPRGSS